MTRLLTVVGFLFWLAMAVSAERWYSRSYNTTSDDYVVTAKGAGWTWFHHKEQLTRNEFLGFSGECAKEEDEDGNIIFTCSGCFNPHNAIFQIPRFLESLGVDLDLSKLTGSITSKLPIPQICIDPCDFDFDISFRGEQEQVRTEEGRQNKERFWDDIADWVDDAVDTVVDEVTEPICDLLDVCTPDFVDMSLSLFDLFGGLGIVPADLKEVMVCPFGGCECFLSSLPLVLIASFLSPPNELVPHCDGKRDQFGDWMPRDAAPPFEGAFELLGDDVRVDLTMGGITLLSVGLENTRLGDFMDKLNLARELKCRADQVNEQAKNGELTSDRDSGTLEFCNSIGMPLFSSAGACVKLNDIVLTGKGFQACMKVDFGEGIDLGCLRVGDLTDCSAFDCEKCMQQSSCGWCPSTSSCVTSDLMGPEKCSECPGGAYTENAALVCGGNSETYEECLASFRTVDSLERDYLVSFEEFFLGPGKWLRYATAEEAFAFLDEDNDGILAFEEFCAFSGEDETGE